MRQVNFIPVMINFYLNNLLFRIPNNKIPSKDIMELRSTIKKLTIFFVEDNHVNQ